MKKESLDEVTKLINYIGENEGKLDKETLQTFRGALNMIMFMEVNSPKIGKFDIFKFIDINDLHLVLRGVHYENGMCHATDGRILVRTKIGYREEFEGKTIAKDGKEIDGKYPNFNGVIPVITKDYTEYEVDFDLIDAYVKAGRIWGHTHPKAILKERLIIKFHGTYLRLMYLQTLCTAMKALGMKSLYVNKENSRCVFMKKDDEVVILMPLCYDEDYHNIDEYFCCEIN